MTVAKTKNRKASRFNASLLFGIIVLSLIILVGVIGPLLIDQKMARVGAVKPNLPPSSENYFGTDSQGRDVFATLVMAIPSTLRTGLVAGVISVFIGLVLGLLAGFFSGRVDSTIRTFSDVLVAVPALAFMILVVARMDKPNIVLVAAVVGLLTWAGTARGIRSQVLSIRERSYTAVARANGESEIEVLFREIMPNLLPLMMASFIGAVTAGIGIVMALEVLGLGNNVIPTLGMMIFWSQRFSAVLRGMYWWWSPPIVTIALIFIGLFFLSQGLDRYINPNIPVNQKRRKQAPELPRKNQPATVSILENNGSQSILQVRNLQVIYETPAGDVKAVDDVSFNLRPGERMGLVGESGSGKTTMATALMRLTRPPAYITAGQIILNGKDLMALSNQGLQRIRLKEIALMPQAAMNSLNPVVRVGPQLRDGFKAHFSNISQKELDERVVDILQKVGLRPEVVDRYPHQLSGGMKQRVAMAIAISLQPKVIIADEPTSALDVVVQKQVMLTLSRLQQELGAAVLLIGHDMGLITQFADTIGVLYAGKLVERGAIGEVLDRPYHPYSRLLIDSLPSIDGKQDLIGIPGLPPELLNLPSGCAFHPRCPFAMEICQVETPEIQSPARERHVACHLYPKHERLPAISTINIDLTASSLSKIEG